METAKKTLFEDYLDIRERRSKSFEKDNANQDPHFQEVYKDSYILTNVVEALLEENTNYKKYFNDGGLIAKPIKIAGLVDYKLMFADNPIKSPIEVAGFCSLDKSIKIIKMNRLLPYDSLYAFLIHEITHAMFYELGEKDLASNERLVYKTATGLHQIIKSNNILDILSGKTNKVNIQNLNYTINTNDEISEKEYLDHACRLIIQAQNKELEILKCILMVVFWGLGEGVGKDYSSGGLFENEAFMGQFTKAVFRTFTDNDLLSPDWLDKLLPENTPIQVGY